MAQESKETSKGSSTAAAKSGTKAATKSAKAKGKATPPVSDGPSCRVEGCKQPVRAKGYCRKHFQAWRRGDTGEHHRYKICSKEACRKPRTRGGFCDEHAGVATPAAEAPAQGGAPAA